MWNSSRDERDDIYSFSLKNINVWQTRKVLWDTYKKFTDKRRERIL